MGQNSEKAQTKVSMFQLQATINLVFFISNEFDNFFSVATRLSKFELFQNIIVITNSSKK